MIDVKDHGAMGDGVTDDWEALDDLINQDKLSPLYFPPGRYRINDTLVFPQRTGYHIVGSGLAPPLMQGSGNVGAESVIIWGGTATDKPMIEIRGTGLVWSGLGLWGCLLSSSSSSCPANRAAYGVNFNQPVGTNPPLGTGKVWFDSILIAHCDEAISTKSDHSLNCDTLAFGYCWLEDCDYGLRLRHQQCLQYTFQHLRAVDVGTIFRVDQQSGEGTAGGGRIFTQTVDVDSDVTAVLSLQGGGKNSAFYDLGGVVIHEDATNVSLIVSDPDKAGDHHVRFTNGHFRNNATVYINRNSGGHTTLELVGCRGVGSLAGRTTLIGTSGKKAILFVRDCEITGLDDMSDLVHTASNYRIDGLENWKFPGGTVTNSSTP